MKKLFVSASLAACVAFAGAAHAAGAGACLFSGDANIKAPLSSVPATGHPGFTFSGKTSGPACGALSGTVVSNDGKFPAVAACEGNVHQGTASTGLGQVSYAGVCVGADCSGVGYNTAGRVFQYNLVFNADTLTRATVGGECADGKFSKAGFDGTAAGASN